MRTTFIVALVAMTSGQSEAVRLHARSESTFGLGDGMDLFGGVAKMAGNLSGVEAVGSIGEGIAGTTKAASTGDLNGALTTGIQTVGSTTTEFAPNPVVGNAFTAAAPLVG